MTLCFFFNDTATTEIYTLSLHDALPILSNSNLILFISNMLASPASRRRAYISESSSAFRSRSSSSFFCRRSRMMSRHVSLRSEEHTSELQSRQYLVCRLLLEKKKQCSTLHSSGMLGQSPFPLLVHPRVIEHHRCL